MKGLTKKLYMLIGLIVTLVAGSAGIASAQSEVNHLYVRNSAPRQHKKSIMVPLSKVLAKIERTNHITFLYQSGILEDKTVYQTVLTSTDLAHKVGKLLAQNGLTYLKQAEGTYIIQRRSPLQAATQQEPVTGTVTDESTGQTLPGVNISIKGTTTGTSTDAEGKYELGVESLQDTLVFSFVGYQTSTVSIEGRTSIDVALKEKAIGLNEMVVIGYGKEKRSNITGAISSIKPGDIENVAAHRIDEALQGHIAGVNVIKNSGEPGGNITIRVRGTNSINAGSDPLFVVDGVPGGADLNSIPKEDIESIEVLKDASATAIYGSRGAGGVVIITTKQGEKGETKVDFNGSYGWQRVSKKLDLLNATEFAQFVNEGRENDNLSPVYDNPSSLGKGTNWQDELFRVAPEQKYNLAVSGGGDNISYRLSGNYLIQKGIIRSSNFKRGGMRVNLNGDISDRITFAAKVNFTKKNRRDVSGKVVRDALLFNPILPVKNSDGSYTRFNVPQITIDNPVAEAIEPRVKNSELRLFGDFSTTISILDDLDFKTRIGGIFDGNQNKSYTPTVLQEGAAVGGIGNINTGNSINWVSNNTLTYHNTFNDIHDLTLLGGFTYQSNDETTVSASAENFVSDKLAYNNLGLGSRFLSPNSGREKWLLLSYLFRSNYVLNDKYLFTLTGRYDGSSKFGKGNKYGFFPSGAFTWRLSNEGFFNNDVVNNLAIRTSYGIAGNQNIGTYAALSSLSIQNYVLGTQQAINIGVGPNSLPNPNLKWETTAQFDVGFDLSLFKNNRLSITADYYHKKTDDLLLQVSLPAHTGFGSYLKNVGSVKNAGLEFSLNSTNISTSEFQWNTSFNITKNNNEVTDLGPKKFYYPNITLGQATQININSIIVKEGEELGSFYGYISDGIFQNKQEIESSAQPDAQVGSERFVDTNGDHKFTSADKTIIGSGQPDFYGGITNSFSYKEFQLNIHMQMSYGADILNSSRIALESLSGSTNNLSAIKNRWTPNNKDTNIPRATAGAYPLRVSSRFIEDGSYLRLNNITLNYNFPKEMLGGSTLKNAKIFLSATNLFTITGYSGYDPGLNYQGGSNVAYSIDYSPYPNAKIYTLGVSLKF